MEYVNPLKQNEYLTQVNFNVDKIQWGTKLLRLTLMLLSFTLILELYLAFNINNSPNLFQLAVFIITIILSASIIVAGLRIKKKYRIWEKNREDLLEKNKSIIAQNLRIIKMNQVIKQVKSGLEEMKFNEGNRRAIAKIRSELDSVAAFDKEWDQQLSYYASAQPHFISTLKSKFPDLSRSEVKLCLLISQNLDTKEIANILGHSVDSVKTARCRLRKKLELQKSENLHDALLSAVIAEKQTSLHKPKLLKVFRMTKGAIESVKKVS